MWYVCGLRGVAANLVLTCTGWYSIFGVYLLADGVLCCAGMFFGGGSGGLAFLVAAAGLIAGAVALSNPLQRLQLGSILLAARALILGLTTLGARISRLSSGRQVLWSPLIGAELVALTFAALLLLPEVQKLVDERSTRLPKSDGH
jgi:hypothetical protein